MSAFAPKIDAGTTPLSPREQLGAPALSRGPPPMRGFLPGSLRASRFRRAWGCPGAFGEGYPAVDEPGAFAFEEAALKPGKWFANCDSTARGDNAVPGNSLTLRRCGHGTSGSPSPARELRGAGQLAVGNDAPLGDTLDHRVDLVPGARHGFQDNRSERGFPVLPH